MEKILIPILFLIVSTACNGQNKVILNASKHVLTKNMTLESPVTASENFGMLEMPVAITITSVKVVLVGSSPSVTYNLAFGTDRTSGTNVFTSGQTVTSTTTGTTASGFNDATVPAGSFIWLTTSAASGTITQFQIRITYTED